MANSKLTNKQWFRSTWMVALSLLVMITTTGCPGKKNSNNIANPYGYGYGYGGTYCNQLNGCYGQAGYGQMFVSGLGKIDSPSSLQAEIALSFNATSTYNNLNAYSGNATLIGTMNVYSSSGICPIPPGQYQLYGNAMTFNGGMSFVGQAASGGGQVVIEFTNTFLSQGPVQSVVGPTFAFRVQNNVNVSAMTYYGAINCGPYVMY